MYFYHYYTPEKRNRSFPSQQQLNLIAFYSTSREKKGRKELPLVSPRNTLLRRRDLIVEGGREGGA
jgi:hypothetical protein